MNFIENMTQEQSSAIMSDAPLVIVKAGAGTGKTRVLINRARRLRSLGHNVLLTTFTRASRKEIEDRISTYDDNSNDGSVNVFTLNALAWRIAGRPRFTSYNEKVRYMRNIISQKQIIEASQHEEESPEEDKKNTVASEWVKYIDRLHANAVFGYCENIEDVEVRDVLNEWDKLCAEKHIIDETTVFKMAIDAIDNKEYLIIWDDILIDESQDLNKIQYDFIRKMAMGKSLFMVGDPDQSIYGFRASIPGFMTDMYHYEGFNHNDIDFISLTENYRCTNQILIPAVTCINTIRYRSTPKILRAQKNGDPLRVLKFPNDKQEAVKIVDKIELLLMADVKHSEIAVIGRTHRSLNEIVTELSKRHISYVQMGSAFMDRPEVIEIQAIVNLLLDPNDWESANIVNRSLYKRKDILEPNENDGSAYQTLRNRNNTSKHSMKNNYMDTLIQMTNEQVSASIIIHRIFSWFEIFDNWKNRKECRFLVHSINDLTEMSNESDTLEEFASALETRRYEMEGAKKTENAVFLGTIFSSKGLEFEHVFIPGAFLGGFPSMEALNEDESFLEYTYNPIYKTSMDEEKRLLYVGITRAMKSCTITWPSKTGKRMFAKERMMSPLLYSLKVKLP